MAGFDKKKLNTKKKKRVTQDLSRRNKGTKIRPAGNDI